MSAERFDEPFWRWLDRAWVRSAPSLRIVAIFVLLGPLIFDLIFVAPLPFLALIRLAGWKASLELLVIAVVGLPVAFWYGSAPALATGLVVAIRQARFGHAGVGTAAASGAVLTAAAAVVTRGRRLDGADWETLLSLIACGVGASIACWWIAIGRRVAR